MHLKKRVATSARASGCSTGQKIGVVGADRRRHRLPPALRGVVGAGLVRGRALPEVRSPGTSSSGIAGASSSTPALPDLRRRSEPPRPHSDSPAACRRDCRARAARAATQAPPRGRPRGHGHPCLERCAGRPEGGRRMRRSRLTGRRLDRVDRGRLPRPRRGSCPATPTAVGASPGCGRGARGTPAPAAAACRLGRAPISAPDALRVVPARRLPGAGGLRSARRRGAARARRSSIARAESTLRFRFRARGLRRREGEARPRRPWWRGPGTERHQGALHGPIAAVERPAARGPTPPRAAATASSSSGARPPGPPVPPVFRSSTACSRYAGPTATAARCSGSARPAAAAASTRGRTCSPPAAPAWSRPAAGGCRLAAQTPSSTATGW